MGDEVQDPWLLTEEIKEHFPVSCVFDDDFKPFTRMPDSNYYLSVLEKKLKRLKGNKKLTSSSMVDAIEKSKEDHMSNLLQGSASTSCIEDSENFTMDSTLQNLIKAKLCPEKLALSAEELQSLLAADQLGLLSQLTEGQNSQSNTN